MNVSRPCALTALLLATGLEGLVIGIGFTGAGSLMPTNRTIYKSPATGALAGC